jgi:hypothetical protein
MAMISLSVLAGDLSCWSAGVNPRGNPLTLP